MPFAQLIIGPPGSGKSTYCDGMHQFMGAIGRQSSVVNLDPANDETNYPCALDIRELVTLEEIMEQDELGPNGGVLHALEELERNWEWFEKRLQELGEDYILFDCPGQVELFTHHASLRNIFSRIQQMGYRLVVMHLTDSYCLTLPSLYISTLLLSLRSMLQLDLPHINVLTKIDKLSSYEPLAFNLEYYTEVHDLSYLLPAMSRESPHLSAKFEGLNNAIIELVEEFSLVSFETLVVEDKRSMMTLLQVIDRAGGYAFGTAEGANDTVWQVTMREGFRGMTVQDVQERWVDRREEFDEIERAEEEARSANEAALDGADEDHNDEDDEDDLEEERRQILAQGFSAKVTRRE